MERWVLAMRRRFRETSVLGEYGAPAIHAALSKDGHAPVPSGGEHRSHPGPLRRARRRPPRASPTPAPRVVSAGGRRRRLQRGPQDRRWPAADTPHCDLSAWRVGGCLGARAPHCEIHGRLPARALVARGPAPACPTTTLSSRVRISSPKPSGASAACAWRRASSRPQRPTPRAGRRAPTPPATLRFDPNVPLRGTLIYLRRTDAAVVLNSSAERSRSRLNGCIAWFVARRSHSPAYPILCLAPSRTRRAIAANNNQHTVSPHTTAFRQRLMSDRQFLIIAQWPFWHVLKDRTFNAGLQWRQWRMLGRTVWAVI